MTSALITGAAGFIGRHLAKSLVERGFRVRALVRRTSQTNALESLGVELVYGDLATEEDLSPVVQGMDVVFHVAGLTSAIRGRDLMTVNGWGTSRICRACLRQSHPPCHIYVSSIAASGPVRRGQVRCESDPAQPISAYGRSKRAGEVAALSVAHAVPTTIVRPGIVFGEENRDMLPVFRSVYRARAHLIAGLASPPLSLIHIEDLIEILVRCWERGHRVEAGKQAPGTGIYFGVCDEYPNYAQLGRILRRILGRPHALLMYLPDPAPWLVGGLGQLLGRIRGQSDTLNLDKIREASAESWACSTAALHRDLDFEFPYSLEQRLCATRDWYLDHDLL